jgi:hypothetical protein
MYRPKSLRQHRSAPVAVQLDEPVMTARTEIWLSQAIDAPLDEAKVDVNVRITEEVAGEVTSVDTWSFDVAEARQVASLMLLLAKARRATCRRWRCRPHRLEVDPSHRPRRRAAPSIQGVGRPRSAPRCSSWPPSPPTPPTATCATSPSPTARTRRWPRCCPVSVDGMMVVATIALGDGRHNRWSAWLAFWSGVAASVVANVLAAEPSMVARTISAWPAVAFLLVVEVITRGARIRPVAAGSSSPSRRSRWRRPPKVEPSTTAPPGAHRADARPTPPSVRARRPSAADRVAKAAAYPQGDTRAARRPARAVRAHRSAVHA